MVRVRTQSACPCRVCAHGRGACARRLMRTQGARVRGAHARMEGARKHAGRARKSGVRVHAGCARTHGARAHARDARSRPA
eukprot:1525806-Pleurochrysis_carterae.AAC.1